MVSRRNQKIRKPLGERDVRLLKCLEGACRVSYGEVARRVGVTHTAVRKRVAKLISGGYLNVYPSLNVEKLGFNLALLFLEVATDEDVDKLLSRFRGCPRIIHMFRVVGEYNLAALIYAEDSSVMESILGTCMLRTAEGIRRSLVIPVARVLLNKYFNLKVPAARLDIAPCGIDCKSCKRFREGRCTACPSVKCYKGWFSAYNWKKIEIF